jgi:hypothetical protein
MASQRSSGRVIGGPIPLLLILAGVALCSTIILLALGQSSGAIATGIFLVLLLGAAAVDMLMTQRKLATHRGDVKALDADAQDAVPAVVQSEEEPVGVSSDVHTDLNPHDLPIDHPGREAVEERHGDGEATAGEPRRDKSGFELGG